MNIPKPFKLLVLSVEEQYFLKLVLRDLLYNLAGTMWTVLKD